MRANRQPQEAQEREGIGRKKEATRSGKTVDQKDARNGCVVVRCECESKMKKTGEGSLGKI